VFLNNVLSLSDAERKFRLFALLSQNGFFVADLGGYGRIEADFSNPPISATIRPNPLFSL
jgi:hypothetical protein